VSTTTEKDETQVSITTSDGRTTEMGSLSEFEERTDDAVRRLRGEQLSFQVGLPGNKPDVGSVKVSGSLGVGRDLRRQQEVVVTVALADGTVLASGHGKVTGIGFKDTEDKYGLVTTERIHTISL
jgi:hypothetical protein